MDEKLVELDNGYLLDVSVGWIEENQVSASLRRRGRTNEGADVTPLKR